uniref:Uncharacterized protein n=1 Tax=Romanomermis culicivorax TaxID=13658 RepID=A0A915IF29_ROMCU
MDSRNYTTRYDLSFPIQQLQIRVRLERVFSGIEHKFSNLPTLLHRESGRTLQQDRGEQRRTHLDDDKEEKVLKWQEKVFSRREVLLYSNEENCQTNIQRQYHSSITDKQREFGEDLGKNRIFSYTEIDNEEKTDEKKLILVDKLTSHLAEKVASLRHRKVAPKKRGSVGDPVAEFPSLEAIKRARSRPKVQIMRIMAYLGDRTSATPQRQDEFVLCSLTLLNDKHLFIGPDFNGIFSPENYYKQFLLSKPYRIESSLGVFQYTIENVGDSTAARDLTKEFEDKIFIDKEHKSKFYRSDLTFHIPQDGILDVLYLCELSEAFGFEYDNLFVRYFVDLPKGIRNFDIPTWRILDGRQESELRRFFLGGSLELEDLTLMRPPINFDKPMFGRLGYQTVSSGTVKMKIQTIHQCNDDDDDNDGLNSNIIRILESFQKARKRMIAIRDRSFILAFFDGTERKRHYVIERKEIFRSVRSDVTVGHLLENCSYPLRSRVDFRAEYYKLLVIRSVEKGKHK